MDTPSLTNIALRSLVLSCCLSPSTATALQLPATNICDITDASEVTDGSDITEVSEITEFFELSELTDVSAPPVSSENLQKNSLLVGELLVEASPHAVEVIRDAFVHLLELALAHRLFPSLFSRHSVTQAGARSPAGPPTTSMSTRTRSYGMTGRLARPSVSK